MEERKKLILYHTVNNNYPDDLEKGEIAIQNSEDLAAIYLRKGDNIAKIIDEEEVNARIQSAMTANKEVSKSTNKSLLQFCRAMGNSNAQMKPYTDKMRASILDMETFGKLGTGLFIHWGVYAVPAGNYTGPKQSGSTVSVTSTNYNTEWIMRDLAIPRDIYKQYQSGFTAENWDAEEIAKKASEAGMGYIVITMKHHDGFSLYPTEYGSWDVRESAARSTIIDELKEACDKYKLKFGIYFSQYWDWMAEGGFGLNHGGKWCTSDLYTDAQHVKYCNNAVLQLKEMIEKYQPYVLWYDPGTNYAQKYKDIFIEGEEEYYPDVITNDRLDYNRTRGDFGTGERTIYLRESLPYGEACFTMNSTWGYSDNNESKYFGTEKVFKEFLIYSLSYGQNCLMNIGPKGDGSIPAKQIECLDDIKNFINAYGSFRNYERLTKLSMPKWGYMLGLEGNKILCYVVTKNNPSTQTVTIDSVSTNNIESVDILTPNNGASYTIDGNKIIVSGLGLDSKTKIGVVRLNYSETPKHIDANYYYANELIPSRVFPMKNNMTWDFTNLRYSLVPSRGITHSSEFIWDDNNGAFNIALNRTLAKDNPISTDDVTTVTITDLDSSATTQATFNYNINESDVDFELVNGKRYKLSIVCAGTESSSLYNLEGFTFSPKVVIIHPTSVSLDNTEIMIAEGGTGQLEATVLPTDSTDNSVIWSSENETVATVSDGMVTGIKAGETNIIVTTVDGAKSASCHVIITAPEDSVVHATNLALSSNNVTLTIGENTTLIPTVTPTNVTYQNIRWESADESKVTVTNGNIVAVGEGTTTITATLEYDNISATCNVTVNPIAVNSITLDKTSITLIPGYSEEISVTFDPTNATHKDVIWTIDDNTIATVTNGVVFAKKQGTAIVTATSVSGNKQATCNITVNAETYDYLFSATTLDGDTNQGDDTGILLFSDAMPNWTLFGYVHDSKNPNTDNNATLLQCVVNASPWSGYRIDADNNNYPTATSDASPLIPRFLCGTDRYFNPIKGEMVSGKPKIDVTAEKHPICFSRNGNVFKFSIDGVNWITHDGTTDAQLARLVNCPLTVAFDYRRASGQMTTNKYRFLKTDHPCCVSLKNVSEYPFYTLYHTYDNTLTD